MKPPRKNSAFTLIELLVVISIIGILITIAVPNIASALNRAKMTETLANARSLQQATQMMTLDSQQAGSGIQWTTTIDSTGTESPVALKDLFTSLTKDGYITTSDLKKLLSAPGKIPTADIPDAGSIAFNFFKVSDNSPSDQLFVATANWTQGSGMSPTANPYGNKGFVFFTKGGGGGIRIRQSDAQDPKLFPTVDSQNAQITYNYTPLN